MSLVSLIPNVVGGVQGAVASVSIVKNILAGLIPSISGLSAIAEKNKDINGFEFDYIGEERLEAGADITKHYTEDNDFMQDHSATKPTVITVRGFVSETRYNKKSRVGSILALSSALATVQPYIGQYAPGASAKMQDAVTQTDQIVNQLAQIINIGVSVTKLVGGISKTRVQEAYNELDSFRIAKVPFGVITPWAIFGDNPLKGHGQMMIENLIMVSPEATRGWADIIVRLVEIRVVPSLLPTTMGNSRGDQTATQNGSVAKAD